MFCGQCVSGCFSVAHLLFRSADVTRSTFPSAFSHLKSAWQDKELTGLDPTEGAGVFSAAERSGKLAAELFPSVFQMGVNLNSCKYTDLTFMGVEVSLITATQVTLATLLHQLFFLPSLCKCLGAVVFIYLSLTNCCPTVWGLRCILQRQNTFRQSTSRGCRQDSSALGVTHIYMAT